MSKKNFKNISNIFSVNNMQTIDGRKIRDEILEKVAKEVARLSFKPVFCDVLVGDSKVLVQYVEMKKKMAEKIRIAFEDASFPISITTDELVQEIQKLNKIPNMCGVIVQLPIPEHLDKKKVLDAIDPKLDVDCLGSKTSEEFYTGKPGLAFPAALACVKILDLLSLDLNGKNILILGQGELVGKPVSVILERRGLKIKIVDSKTENKENLIKEADIIISGIGQGKYITGSMIKNGAILIDAGTSESNAGIVGDVDLESVKDIASFVSPVPGGVGPVTVAMLFSNVLNVAKSLK